jgi:hypothetical protein
MTIVKNNKVFVLMSLATMVNLAFAECNKFEPAAQFYQDKVHEFLGYLGVENAEDVGVYKMQENNKDDYRVSTVSEPGIWINEDMQSINPAIKTEQDIIWRLAMASVNYASGSDQMILQVVGIRGISLMTAVMNNIFLTLLARCSFAKHYSLKSKILAGIVANIGMVVAAVNLDKYFIEKIFWPNMREHLKKDAKYMVRMLRHYGYQEAAQAYVDYSDKYVTI